MEFLDVVNNSDEVVGQASIKDIYSRNLTHRIVHVFVLDSHRRIALQLRSKNKAFLPEHWCTSAGGHVSAGESYEKAALREMSEEIGITTKLYLLGKDLYVNSYSPVKFLMTFTVRYNGPFSINDEVEKVQFFTIDEIRTLMENGAQIHPELRFLLEKYFLQES